MEKTDTVSRFISSAESFYNDLQKDANGRYRSWEYCYKCFHDARKSAAPDYDYLSLQLAFYLASWGMYRASSFLLQKDYKVHTPAVKEILDSKYDCLLGLECNELRAKHIQALIVELSSKLKDYYKPIRDEVLEKSKGKMVNSDLSGTLITKILMGTLGCVPAYDRFFISGVKSQKVTSGIYNIKSLEKLADFYEKNHDCLEKVRSKMKVDDLPYPQMKLLDMGFWQIGYVNN